ncbi:MAG: sugar ABC transporter permease [Eubacteriales bacterium]
MASTLTKKEVRKSAYSTKYAKKEAVLGYLFILPSVVGLVLFLLYPIFSSFKMSLYDWPILSDATFIGIENYTTMITDTIFQTAFLNTFKWVIIYVPVSICASMVLALAMDMPLRGISFFRTLFYFPVVTPLVVVSLLFVWIYNVDYGILNYLLSFVGISKIGWLTDTNISLYSIALMSVWKNAGYNMLIILAALQGVPRTLYEAAVMEGASAWQKFRFIKLPLIMPAMYFVVITSCIDAFQVFTEVYIMTSGGPGYSTYTVSFYLWENAFNYGKMGYASAMAVVMFLAIMTITIIQHQFLNKSVQYDT